MKLTMTALLLFISLAAMAKNAPSLLNTPLPHIPANPEMEKFGNSLCISLVNATVTGKNTVKTMENKILIKMNLSRSTPSYQDKIIEFWNQNNRYFICKGKINSNTRDSEHIMKRALALKMHQHVFYKFLLKHRHTDVNAVEWVNGQPETVLDYLDNILADPKAEDKYIVRDIQRLRDVLSKVFNAKTAKELYAVSH